MNSIVIRTGTYEIKGVTRTDKGYQFVWKGAPSFLRSQIALVSKGEEVERIDVSDDMRRGSLYSVILEDLPKEVDGYRYYQNGQALVDEYARSVFGLKNYGNKKDESKIYYLLPGQDFDWEGDLPLRIPYENSIIYGLHARGFTKSASSGVKAKGCFAGIAEKVDYLKTLGITAIELMPAYEFDEMYVKKKTITTANIQMVEEKPVKPNFWGFATGYYYAPKSGYTMSADPVNEYKNMVKALHAAGIEVIMQMYFATETPVSEILDILKHWVNEYHVDGFRLIGASVPYTAIATDPYLTDTKLIGTQMPINEIYGDLGDVYKKDAWWRSFYRNIGIINKEFLEVMRKVLKGESESLERFLCLQRDNGYVYSAIHGLDDYDGFNLMDLVSFDRKHNEANGEDNRDGSPYEMSWNCGAEGKTRKKAIIDLRYRQIRNALSLILLSQGTPFIKAGDECGFSQDGNNNPYCQDNATTWMNWKLGVKDTELLEFTKKLIAVRKSSSLFSKSTPMAMMDTLSCGYPDVSYHGIEPWQSDLSAYQSYTGVLYYGAYGKKDNQKSYYVIYNLHWDAHTFDLPKIKNANAWDMIISTDASMPEVCDGKVEVPGRCIVVLESR